VSFATRTGVLIAIALGALAAGALPAQAAQRTRVSLLKDIDPGRDGSFPNRFGRLGNSVYFSAYSPSTGEELWRTDGTRRGTEVVADIVPGPQGSVPRGMQSNGRYVFFTVLEPDRTRRVWRSDGTAAGTGPIPGTEDPSVFSSEAAAGDLFLFLTSDPGGFPHVWATDGDSPPVEIGSGYHLVPLAFDGAVYLSLFEPGDVASLWRTDGTAAGTSLVRSGSGDVVGGSGPPDYPGPAGLTALGGSLYFFAGGLNAPGLWRSDGTAAGTTQVTGLPGAFVAGSDVRAVLGGRIVFTLGNRGLWATDGTAAGTRLVGAPQAGRYLTGLTATADGAYLSVDSRLWRTDGTATGTVKVAPGALAPSNFVAAGGLVLFAVSGDKRGSGLWQTDGTEAGTRPSGHVSRIAELTAIGRRAVFTASDPRHGPELYVAKVAR
jgi:ELWxxDGT repeat protein